MNLQVLVVDDEAAIRDSLAEYLSRQNEFRVVTAADGQEALQLLRPGRFDCAFVDLRLPGLDGLELLSRFKAQDPTLPVVIITGYPTLDGAIEAMRQGASDFLIKPIKPELVKATLERVVREHRLLQDILRLNERLKQQDKIGRLNQELRRRVRQQQRIQEIFEAIDRLQSSEEIYQGLVELARRHLDADKAAVLLRRGDSNEMMVSSVAGFPAETVGQTAAVWGEGVIGKVAAAGLPLMGGPTSKSAGNGLLPTGGYLCLPIKMREVVLGVMLVGDKRGGLPFQGDDLFLARFLVQKAAQAIENVTLYEAMASNLRGTLDALVKASEAKDPHFLQHSQRVTDLAVATGQALHMDAELLESLRFASYLHDVGKIGIKDEILQKEEGLDQEEYEQIKQHPLVGESIMGPLDLSAEERDVVLFHHERLDGSGYPQGLSGADIPFTARVVAVADAFDAMTSDRAYRPGKSRQQAAQEIKRLAGSKFDAQVVEAFLAVLEHYQSPEQSAAPEPPWHYFRRRRLAKNG